MKLIEGVDVLDRSLLHIYQTWWKETKWHVPTGCVFRSVYWQHMWTFHSPTLSCWFNQ